MRFINRRLFTLIELMVCVVLMSMLSTALFFMMTSARDSMTHGTRSLEILQACSLIMTQLRKELRVAPETPSQINGKLMIDLGNKKESLYYFDPPTQMLYTGERDCGIDTEPMPGVDLFPYKFDNGQIIDFRFDSSDRGEEAWLINEMSLNNRYWFKAEMEIVFSKKWKGLSDEAKQIILADPKNRRRFSITITPRRKNWILQNTQ